ncbi:protein of unknown function [Saccharicrinis carchari]|uniref:DUF4301 domain-containing protein n=1 Tax=Saccharicrinis carchari TaxID=1168039 RepID=A0A521EPU8_SACCC|nr:DUF4301 family protein [Saccharicrinis carchari]SMO85935.1 protein of unknown function [Saccharicrinis carchari]
MITDKDISLLKSKGITTESVNKQLKQFEKGFAFMDIQKPASTGKGIIVLDEEEKLMFTDQYRAGIDQGCSVIKFVPASGAATRMFKDMFTFINADKAKQEELKKQGPVQDFLSHINHFAFSQELAKVSGIDFSDKKAVMDNAVLIVEKLLLSNGLNYGNHPKGVLKFHLEGDRATTPIEEHLCEGATYGQDNEGNVNIHFTVSGDHKALFQEVVNKNIPYYEAKYDVKFNISFSEQKEHTDTIAVNPDNSPFRTEDGKLLFRPGGHGALIENLNDLEADIIFIKNIDNVIPEYRLKDTIQHKEALAGVLYQYQQKIFDYLQQLSSDKENLPLLEEILDFMQDQLFIALPEGIAEYPLAEKRLYIISKLNRPIRVCGMVKNEGEPGGGPFWGIGKYGETSLQIVEGSQIDMENPEKKNLVKKSTHFNPVDLVCGTKDYKGNKFDLLEYVDPKTGFISDKSVGGRVLKALELPGLWNGAMSDWITLFVEVPISTFNPVKTVNDLLRPQHQPENTK